MVKRKLFCCLLVVSLALGSLLSLTPATAGAGSFAGRTIRITTSVNPGLAGRDSGSHTLRLLLYVHVVRAGDTLESLASRYGATVNDIVSTNRLQGTSLNQGQVLVIPVNQGQSPSPAQPDPVPVPDPVPEKPDTTPVPEPIPEKPDTTPVPDPVPEKPDPAPEKPGPGPAPAPQLPPGPGSVPGSPDPVETPGDGEETLIPGITRLTADEQLMLGLVNQERSKHGLSPLKIDLELTRVARLKSQDMVDLNYFSHQSPTYGSPFEMMRREGIEFVRAGENIAGSSSVERAHQSLMNSPGHRANILNSSYTHVGIGIVDGTRYGKIFTQMFIQKRS